MAHGWLGSSRAPGPLLLCETMFMGQLSLQFVLNQQGPNSNRFVDGGAG